MKGSRRLASLVTAVILKPMRWPIRLASACFTGTSLGFEGWKLIGVRRTTRSRFISRARSMVSDPYPLLYPAHPAEAFFLIFLLAGCSHSLSTLEKAGSYFGKFIRRTRS